MRLIILFNLKPDVTFEDYEGWARAHEMPMVRALPSVDDFQVYRTKGLFGSAAAAPYAYVQIIDVADAEGFDKDIASAAVQASMAEFAGLADTPAVIVTEALSLV